MTRGAPRSLALASVALLVSACGLPSDGARAVDEADVPYHLLDERTDAQPDGSGEQPTSTGPLLFWVGPDGRLVPRPAQDACLPGIDDLLRELLDSVAAGPAEQDRTDGLGTAIPPESGLELAEVEGDLVFVEIETEADLSAERLPVAVAQLVLTMTSAPGIDRVSLVSDGEAIQMPLADGALTTAPVTPADYVSLVPPRYRGSSPFRSDVTRSQSCPGS